MSEPAVYAALLRGINVSGARKVPMAGLRELLTGLGHGAARTHLQSGNAVFTAPAGSDPARLRADLEAAVADRFGFAVPCLILTRAELDAAAGRCPYTGPDHDPAKAVIVFLDGPAADHPVAAADPAAYAPDEFRLGEREIFAWFPGGMGRSRLGEVLHRPVRGLTATARNLRTVEALRTLAAGLS